MFLSLKMFLVSVSVEIAVLSCPRPPLLQLVLRLSRWISLFARVLELGRNIQIQLDFLVVSAISRTWCP
jgi:hypothetical protein